MGKEREAAKEVRRGGKAKEKKNGSKGPSIEYLSK